MNRLGTSQNSSQMTNSSATTYVPPTRKPTARTDGSRANEFDAYGHRPLVHPWKLLSAREFLQQWRCEPLLMPKHYSGGNQPARKKLTNQGDRHVRSQQYKTKRKVTAKPGGIALPSTRNLTTSISCSSPILPLAGSR